MIEQGATLYENVPNILIDVTIRSGTALCTGVGSANATIDGMGLAPVIHGVYAEVTLRDITLTNGHAWASGQRGGGITVAPGG